MVVRSNGEVQLPEDVQVASGIMPGTVITCRVEDGRILIEKSRTQTTGKAVVEYMTGRGSVDLTTDEILAATREA